jgi:hypothetical protein
MCFDFYKAIRISVYAALNSRASGKQRGVKYLERIGHGLIKVLSQNMPGGSK